MGRQREWFLEMESASGEGSLKIMEINLVGKAGARFERVDFNFERSSVGTVASHATEKW